MRAVEILKVLQEYFIFNRYNKHSVKILGKRIREACEKLGTTYIKFGQMLAGRYELLSEKDRKELQPLFNNLEQIPYSKVAEIIKHDLGKYPEEIFDEFEPKPIASASIAQVHKATLQSGEVVAVKVRKPYISKKIIKDMNLLIKLIALPQFFSPTLRTIDAKNILNEMKSWLLQEIDFENEVRNMIKIKKSHHFCDGKKYRKDLGYGKFLYPYRDLCSKNIITMTYIEGVPLNDANSIRDNPDYDILLSIKSFFNASIHALFNSHKYFFQTDPHPANILILKHGQASIIDCGLIGEISLKDLKKMRKLFLDVYSGNLKNTIKSMLELGNVRYEKYAFKIKKDVKNYLAKTPYEGVGFWFMEVVKIFIKYKIKVPRCLVQFGRSNLVLDGCLKSIYPEKNTLDLIGKELKTSMRRQMFRNLADIKYEPLLYNLSEKIKESPQVASQLIEKYYSRFKKDFL